MRLIRLLFAAVALVSTAASAQDKPEQTFSELFAERNVRTLAVLKAEFPDDSRALLARVKVIGDSDLSQMLKLSGAFEALSGIRKNYADRLAFAPAQALTALLVAAAGYHEAVLEGEGPGACGVFAQNGSGALFQLNRSEAYAQQIDLQSALYLEAVAGAIEQPENYGAIRQEDFTMLLAAMSQAGVSKDYLTAIAGGQPSDPNLCPALATMFKAAAILDTPEGLRVRADLARNLAGY